MADLSWIVFTLQQVTGFHSVLNSDKELVGFFFSAIIQYRAPGYNSVDYFSLMLRTSSLLHIRKKYSTNIYSTIFIWQIPSVKSSSKHIKLLKLALFNLFGFWCLSLRATLTPLPDNVISCLTWPHDKRPSNDQCFYFNNFTTFWLYVNRFLICWVFCYYYTVPRISTWPQSQCTNMHLWLLLGLAVEEEVERLSPNKKDGGSKVGSCSLHAEVSLSKKQSPQLVSMTLECSCYGIVAQPPVRMWLCRKDLHSPFSFISSNQQATKYIGQLLAQTLLIWS